ncbi:hypothetical protein ACP70R_005204 [Stipagrostis hirtigluma subsp. patula]
MEGLVGRAVRKAFPGFGVFAGVVESYDAEAGYFRVLYEDGDSEEVDAEEMAGMLVGPAMPEVPRTPPGAAAGRRPKKRRRGDGDGEESPPEPQADGVVLAVPAEGEPLDAAAGPATPVEGGGEVAAGPVGKKRRVSPAPESSKPVRRSARQAKAAARAAEMEAAAAVAAAAEAAEAEAAAEAAAAAAAATPKQSGRKRPRANGNGRYRSVSKDLEEAAVDRLPPKPELPPSSQGLDFGGLPVPDVFQVYSCLRSFSRQLFLSPFPLETFVAALQCTYVNPLIDWVHFAMLRALKGHLEYLANEGPGDPSAIHCIRNLNWELLDLATWPIYLAEYLLTRCTELKYGVKLTDLKLLSTEYYRQPATVKLELLRSLSDDVLLVEAIRARIESDGNDEGFTSTGSRRKRRGSSSKRSTDSSPPPVGSDDMDDGNSDECYLCGMDGNLLCCDGCPAAFHSKCVGVVEDLLPEGDWYCPECLIEKNDGSRNMRNSFKGAQALGIDPHGRLYYGTCGYLLVIDSQDMDAPCHYYRQIDLHSLVTVLNSCHPSYSSLVNAISMFSGTAVDSPNMNGRYKSSKECSTSNAEKDVSPLLDQDASHQNITLRSALMSESGNETAAVKELNQMSQNSTSGARDDLYNSQQDVIYSHANGLSAENQKDPSCQKRPTDYHLRSDPPTYINYYSFGQIAASAAEELKHRLSENKEGKNPAKDTVSLHLRTICKKYANIFALTDQKLSVELLKEKCGWCNSCQISGGVDCIFRVTDVKCMERHASGLQAEKNKESHIVLAIHNILSIEERLNGLLTGPWQNPQYSDSWRKAVLKASDVSSLKQPLLMLESSLRRIAISVEWQKPADSVEVVGSAAHILVRTSNKSSHHQSARKPGRKPSSNGELKVDSRDVGVYWRRGGTLSRQVFHWKRLPQSLACKAARQAGRRKIPTILYPDGSQFARRFKYIAWRAAVEMAENVAQLILQIKELEWNIKWTEMLSTLPSSLATKETKKLARLFKKVIVRRKRTEGANVEYLLDFGKRENIPPVVSKHGTKLEEPSNERTRYWLSEVHVPLNLLKAYEAKSLSRLLKKKETDDLPKKTKKRRESKPSKPKISAFDYLFERAKKLATRLCGQCNKEVIDREAVNCQYCAALFHRRHFKVPRGATDAVYVCNKCLAEKVLQVKSPQKKTVPKKTSPLKKTSPKKKQKKQPRKIVTRRNQILLKYKNRTGKKKGKRGRPRKNPLNVSKNESPKMPEDEPSNVPKNEPVKRISKRLYDKYMKGNSDASDHTASRRKRKRTAVHYSYWLNGLQWTQNPDDERARNFRKDRVVFPSEDAEISKVSPVCCLCEKCYSGDAIFISCEKCEGWFHGDIYSITLESVKNLIGFKCHRCRLRDVPVCPYAKTDAVLKSQSNKENSVNGFIADEDQNCPKDLDALDSQTELHDQSVEKKLNGHITENQDHDFLEELNDSKLDEVDNYSTEKLDDVKCLKELGGNNKLKEVESPVFEKEPGDPNCLKELDDHTNLKELDSYRSEKEPNNNDCLNKLDKHTNAEELDGTEGSKFGAGETHCLKELGNFNSHSCPIECENHNNLKELDNNRSPNELDGTGDSKFAAATAHSADFLDEHFKKALIITSKTDSVNESLALQSKDNSENSLRAEHDIDLQVVVTL